MDLMTIFYIVLLLIAFVTIVGGMFLYFQSVRKENDRKKEGKAYCFFGVIELIGILLMLLGGLWFWVGAVAFLIGFISSIILSGFTLFVILSLMFD